MSDWRSYYAVDNCLLCGSARILLGCRDAATGWLGWCAVCNWKWRYYDVYQLSTVTRQKAVNQNQLSEKIGQMCKWHRGGAEEVCSIICSFLASAHCLVQWESGAAEWKLRKIYRDMKLLLWRHLLLGAFLVRDSMTGLLRPTRESDETITGSADAYLDYPNPLWKCQLAEGDSEERKPLTIIIRMLGKPNYGPPGPEPKTAALRTDRFKKFSRICLCPCDSCENIPEWCEDLCEWCQIQEAPRHGGIRRCICPCEGCYPGAHGTRLSSMVGVSAS